MSRHLVSGFDLMVNDLCTRAIASNLTKSIAAKQQPFRRLIRLTRCVVLLVLRINSKTVMSHLRDQSFSVKEFLHGAIRDLNDFEYIFV